MTSDSPRMYNDYLDTWTVDVHSEIVLEVVSWESVYTLTVGIYAVGHRWTVPGCTMITLIV